MEINEKLEKIGQAFCIEGDYVGYEKIKTGNCKQSSKIHIFSPGSAHF